MRSLTPTGVRNESGFTLIDLLFVIALVGLLSTLAIPGLMRARGAAQAGSALGTVRVINSAQISFAITCGLGFYAPELPTLGMTPPGSIEPFLDSDLASGAVVIRSGYSFSMAITPVESTPAPCVPLGPGTTGPGYALVADPLDENDPGRFYGTNADGVIYEHIESLALTMPEAGPPPEGTPIK